MLVKNFLSTSWRSFTWKLSFQEWMKKKHTQTWTTFECESEEKPDRKKHNRKKHRSAYNIENFYIEYASFIENRRSVEWNIPT